MKIRQVVAGVAWVLVLAELVLVLLSWLLSATMTGDVHSLLSSEGVRWFFGSFCSMLATPWVVWLLLLAMTGGCLWQSGLLSAFSRASSTLGYRGRMAFRTTLVLLIIYIAAVVALTAVPHAVLLSATGQLFPSPFSRSLVPILSFGLLLLSAVYGWVSGRFTSFTDIVDAMSYGIARSAPAFVLYVLLLQLYESLVFVFM